MSCPTCGNAMTGFKMERSGEPITGMLWCPACGTASQDEPNPLGSYCVPKLVERCRKFIDNIGATIHIGDPLQQVVREWYADGIAESIHPPGDRPCSS